MRQFEPCKKLTKLVPMILLVSGRQRKINCGHVYYRGATTANSDQAAVVWELSWSVGHLKCCRSVCNSTEYELQPVWVCVVQSQLFSGVQIQYRVRFTGYAWWECCSSRPQDIPRCGWPRSGTCINNISALSSTAVYNVPRYVPRILLPWYKVLGRLVGGR